MKTICNRLVNFQTALILLIGSGLAQTAHAASSLLDFEAIADGTPLSTQYQSLGVTTSGGVVALTTGTFLVPQSGVNVAYAPSGLMTFTFDGVIASNVQSVSAYLTGTEGVGIYAFDSSNNLIGQALLPASGGINMLLTVTTTTPIASVQIHDDGSTFFVDDFNFITSAPCTKLAGDLKTATSALVSLDFLKPSHARCQRSELTEEASDIAKLIGRKALPSKVLSELNEMLSNVNRWLVTGARKTNLIYLINQLITAEKNNRC